MAADPTDRPLYELDHLYEGCKIWTPLQRWETIKSIQQLDSVRRHVVTDHCAADYGWTWSRWREFDAIIPRGERYVPDPEIRLVDLNCSSTLRMMLVPTAANIEIPDFSCTIAEARYLGRGAGWEVAGRNGAGEHISTPKPSKAAARTLMRSIGRQHAQALGVRYCEHEGHHQHKQES